MTQYECIWLAFKVSSTPLLLTIQNEYYLLLISLFCSAELFHARSERISAAAAMQSENGSEYFAFGVYANKIVFARIICHMREHRHTSRTTL